MKVVGTGLVLNLLASIGIFSYLLNHVGVHPAAMFFATFLIVWAFLIIWASSNTTVPHATSARASRSRTRT